MPTTRLLIASMLLTCLPGTTLAQAPARPVVKPGALSVEEATAVTQGWALLSQGLLADASRRAAEVLAAFPRSSAALALAVEVAIARSGSRAGLEQYERWLGGRSFEEPLIVRRIAEVVLHEVIAEKISDAARLEALRALADDGDGAAAAALAEAMSSGSPGETRALAASGNEAAVKVLIEALKHRPPNAASTIDALGRSGSQLAVQPLIALLQDRAPEVRGAAVQALGRLARQQEVADAIRPLLDDPSGYVRIRAAAALFRLGDTSGESMLRELYASDAEKSRLMAAQAMASRPDALWQDQVRRLTSASEPEVRIEAARLIAPYDPDLARSVIERGMRDDNPAVRDMATAALTDASAGDLRALRGMLGQPDRLHRARAAAHILALTR